MISQFILKIDYNEMDVIPYGYALFNSSWIENDWYLHLEILYRLPFGYVSGFFVHLFGFMPTIFYGRIISYVLFSFAYLNLLKATKTDFIAGCAGLMIFLTYFPTGMYAGEWIIGGLETKVFAYSFALLAIGSALKKQYLSAFLYSGLSLSLHLLIGGYHLICFTSILAYQACYEDLSVKEIFRKCYPFLIGGIWGLVCVFSYLFTPIDEELSRLGWDVYVHIRVPFHVLPKFHFEALFFPSIFSVINVAVLFLLKKDGLKILSFYALITVLISGIGILFYLLGDQSLLRFYFFRYNDAIQPFLTILILGSLFSNHSIDFIKVFGDRVKTDQVLPMLILVSVAILFVLKKEPNIRELFDPQSYRLTAIAKKNTPNIKMSKWIGKNTSEDAVFIVPIDWETFYIDTNRALFVSWKHAPQKPEDLAEWYKRIQLLNRGENLFEKNIDHRKVIATNYQNLTKDELLQLKESYPSVTHLVFSSSIMLDFPEVYRTNDFVLYKL